MRYSTLLGVLTLLASALGPRGTSAAVINFDDVIAPSFFVDQPVQLTTQYSGLGIVFKTPPTQDANEILNNSTFIVPPAATSPNLLASSDLLAIEASFTIPVFSVGALIGISGGSDRLSIFDAGGGLLGSVVGDDTFKTLTSVVPIARFTVTAESGTTPAIDNLTFSGTAVPEPTTVALVGLALLGIVAARARPRRSRS